jgi:hypothetical protein
MLAFVRQRQLTFLLWIAIVAMLVLAWLGYAAFCT